MYEYPRELEVSYIVLFQIKGQSTINLLISKPVLDVRCLHSLLSTLSAFSREFLMDSRWLLDGMPKTAGLCANWHSILKMSPSKQSMFLERLFHLHDVQQRRAGRACVTRLSQDLWQAEIDSICVQTYIFDNMVVSKDSKDNAMFGLDTLNKIKLGILEGNLVIALISFR